MYGQKNRIVGQIRREKNRTEQKGNEIKGNKRFGTNDGRTEQNREK